MADDFDVAARKAVDGKGWAKPILVAYRQPSGDVVPTGVMVDAEELATSRAARDRFIQQIIDWADTF